MFLGYPQLSDTSLYTGLMQTTEFLEGKQVGGRRKETGNRRGKEKGEGIVPVYIIPSLKNKILNTVPTP